MPKQVDARPRNGTDRVPATNFAALARRYWYVLVAVGLVLAFVAWRFMQNRGSAAQGTTTATDTGLLPASFGAPLQPVSGTQPDMSNVIDMLSTQYQNLTNQLAQNQAAPAAAPLPVPAPYNKPTGGGPQPWVTFQQWLHTPGRNDIATALSKGKMSDLQGQYIKETAIVAQKQQAASGVGAGGAALWHATPPQAGADVPFGTIVQTHRPLTSTGLMYALSGRI